MNADPVQLDLFSIEDIAAATRATVRTANRHATRERWQHQEAPLPTGNKRRLYPIATLPDDIADALRAHRDAANTPAEPTSSVPTEVTPLADWQRQTADARRAILRYLNDMTEQTGTLNRAYTALAEASRSGTLPAEIADLIPQAKAKRATAVTGNTDLSTRTLKRWHSLYKKSGWAALAPDAPRDDNKAPPAWAEPLLKLYRRPTEPSLSWAVENLPSHLPAGVPMPSYHQARRFLQSLPPVERERGRRGANELLALQGFKRRIDTDLEPLAVATADGHSFKALVAHPRHGRPFGPEVCAIMDTTTRYVFGWSAGLAESRWVVMDAIRHAVESQGVFAMFFTDNGSGFVNKTLHDTEVRGLLSRIGATPVTAIPGRAQSRGKIERLQSSLWKRAARELVTYTGRDMDREERKKVEKKITRDLRARGASRYLMSWDNFLTWAGEAVDRYNNRPHTALPKIRDPQTGKLRHRSPAEELASWKRQGWTPEALPEPILKDMFRPYERRMVQRGEVQLPWGRYYNDTAVAYHGQYVHVGYDIHDGSRVWVREEHTGRLICVAHRDANVIPEQPKNKVEHAMRQRHKRRLELLERHIEEANAELGPGLIEDTGDRDTILPILNAFSAPVPESVPVETDDDDDAFWDRINSVCLNRNGA